ncbi:MAG TPA: aminotransferase class I/II-fold pyridoxal phosphate-dependent enzyme [Candidatus Nanoarchaeia archaeon]|nr:aminotransferase class I/II-fold pyridoxal phosphate-dependent enzyme [Candidatus Nanoarchaeia archaeon]
MKLDDFKLERYFAEYEFSVPYLLCASDCESLSVQEILSKKELSALLSMKLGYTESQGNPELRKEISKLFTRAKPEDILVCAPQEGIFIVMNALLNPGDKIIVQSPCYQSLFEIAKSMGCQIINWKPETREGWRWNLNFLKENADAKTKLIVINSPHNPTGHLFSKKEYQEIMNIARANNCYVFSDEMYRLLEYDKGDRLLIGADLYERCISLSGMSKTFGMPGLRIGWLSIREKELFRNVLAFKDYTTICNSALSESVALAALRKKDKIIKNNLKIIKDNLAILEPFFLKHEKKFGWEKPKAGPIAFVKIKFDEDAYDFCKKVVKKVGVMLLPSTEYDYGNRHFRIGFGRRNLPEALKAFEKYLKQI